MEEGNKDISLQARKAREAFPFHQEPAEADLRLDLHRKLRERHEAHAQDAHRRREIAAQAALEPHARRRDLYDAAAQQAHQRNLDFARQAGDSMRACVDA